MKSLEFCYFFGEMCDFIHFISMAIGLKRQKRYLQVFGLSSFKATPIINKMIGVIYKQVLSGIYYHAGIKKLQNVSGG